jgi:hypothetical protein
VICPALWAERLFHQSRDMVAGSDPVPQHRCPGTGVGLFGLLGSCGYRRSVQAQGNPPVVNNRVVTGPHIDPQVKDEAAYRDIHVFNMLSFTCGEFHEAIKVIRTHINIEFHDFSIVPVGPDGGYRTAGLGLKGRKEIGICTMKPKALNYWAARWPFAFGQGRTCSCWRVTVVFTSPAYQLLNNNW